MRKSPGGRLRKAAMIYAAMYALISSKASWLIHLIILITVFPNLTVLHLLCIWPLCLSHSKERLQDDKIAILSRLSFQDV